MSKHLPRNLYVKQDAYTRLGITPSQVALAPRIDSLISELGGTDAVLSLLRAHPSADARSFLELWDITSLAVRRELPLEAFALACGIGVERLAEMLVGGALKRGQEAAVLRLARELPKVMDATLSFAQLPDGEADRRAVERMSGLIAQPKGSSTIVNVFQQNAAVQQNVRQAIPSTDEITRRLSDRMNAKMLSKAQEDNRTLDADTELLVLPQATSADTISPEEQLKRVDPREAIPVVRTDWAAQQVEYLPAEDTD